MGSKKIQECNIVFLSRYEKEGLHDAFCCVGNAENHMLDKKIKNARYLSKKN